MFVTLVVLHDSSRTAYTVRITIYSLGFNASSNVYSELKSPCNPYKNYTHHRQNIKRYNNFRVGGDGEDVLFASVRIRNPASNDKKLFVHATYQLR